MKDQKEFKVLCYVDNYEGRDVEILIPLIAHIENYFRCKPKFVLYYDIFAIYRHKPDIILIASIYGSLFNYWISKYAVDQNIKVFSLFSEGRIVCQTDTNYFGNNPIRQFFQEYVCCWSIPIRDFLRKQHPELKHKIVCTGATGFDSYKYQKLPSKSVILKKYNKEGYKKIIGYAGWGFAKLSNKVRRKELEKALNYDKERLQQIAEHRDHVQATLEQLIQNNPDTLFILKKHPQETMPIHDQNERNEMSPLRSYNNVLYLIETEPIKNILNICDIWLCYDSTTASEAWLLDPDLPTFFIQKDNVPIYDSGLKAGGIVIKSYNQIQAYYNEYLTTGKVRDYYERERIDFRTEKLTNAYGYTDGFNHLRAAYYFNKVLEDIRLNKPKHNYKFNFRYAFMWLSMNLGKPFYNKYLFSKLPMFQKTTWIFDRNKMYILEAYKNKISTFLNDFYQRQGITQKIEDKSIYKELIDPSNEPI